MQLLPFHPALQAQVYAVVSGICLQLPCCRLQPGTPGQDAAD